MLALHLDQERVSKLFSGLVIGPGSEALVDVCYGPYRSGASRHGTPANHRWAALGPRPIRRLDVISNSGIITVHPIRQLAPRTQPRSGSATELRLPTQIPISKRYDMRPRQ